MGRSLQRVLVITSGDRNAFEAWHAYRDYLQGGILAAQCCWRTSLHSYEECGKQPRSNHARGRAADVVFRRRKGRVVNIGESNRAREAMKRRGLCLPVGSGETWHVEVGNVWRS